MNDGVTTTDPGTEAETAEYLIAAIDKAMASEDAGRLGAKEYEGVEGLAGDVRRLVDAGDLEGARNALHLAISILREGSSAKA